MNLSVLKYFIEIAECRSFTRASERLFITQPTLSRQIQDLEEEMGVQLLIRGGHALRLTEPGERLLREAKEIVKRCDELREIVRKEEDRIEGVLKIDYQAFLDTRQMFHALKPFSEKNPYVDLTLSRSSNTDLQRDLVMGNCDLAIAMKICVKEVPDLEYIHLQKNSLQIAVPQDHPLAGKTSVPIQQLAEERFIMLERQNSPLTVDYVVGLCTKSGFSPKTSNYVRDIETALLLVGTGKGLTFLFSRMNVNTEDVCIIDIEGDHSELDYVAAYKKDSSNPMVPLFLKELKTE